MSSETDKFHESVTAMERTFQDLSLLLNQGQEQFDESPLESDSFPHQNEDQGLDSQNSNYNSSTHDDLKIDDLTQDDKYTSFYKDENPSKSLKEFNMAIINDLRSSVKSRSKNKYNSDRLNRLYQMDTSIGSNGNKSINNADSLRDDDIREISNLLLDLQDQKEFLKDPETTKANIERVERQAETLLSLVKDFGTKKELDLSREEEFLREIGKELRSTKPFSSAPVFPSAPWEESSFLRSKIFEENSRQKVSHPAPIHKSARTLLTEFRSTLQSPSRFDAINSRVDEVVQEFTPRSDVNFPTRKALLVSIYNPKIPCREDSLKTMCNICRILKFDEIMVLDTKKGTKKGVILHYYNELMKDAGEKDVRLFYIFGEAHVVFKEPLTFSFRDSTRSDTIGVSRWDFETILYTSCIRIWDAVVDIDFDNNICEQSPPISHVSCEITSATPYPNLEKYRSSLFTNGLFEIIRWYSERRKKCTNRSLKFQLRLMLDEGEFKDGAIEFECFRSELNEEFTAPLRAAVELK